MEFDIMSFTEDIEEAVENAIPDTENDEVKMCSVLCAHLFGIISGLKPEARRKALSGLESCLVGLQKVINSEKN